MDEIIKNWFIELYTKEIENVRGTMENERIWWKGSATPEQEEVHLKNIARLTEYERQLLEKVKEVQ